MAYTQALEGVSACGCNIQVHTKPSSALWQRAKVSSEQPDAHHFEFGSEAFGGQIPMTEKQIIAFSGSRILLDHQERKIVAALKRLVPDMSAAITGMCRGVDAFIARWINENTDIDNIIVRPGHDYMQDMNLHCLPNVTWINMPKQSHAATAFRERNAKMVELCDCLVAFRGQMTTNRSGTLMTINFAKRANKLREVCVL